VRMSDAPDLRKMRAQALVAATVVKTSPNTMLMDDSFTKQEETTFFPNEVLGKACRVVPLLFARTQLLGYGDGRLPPVLQRAAKKEHARKSLIL